MDGFHYPLFFEAQKDLTDREREKIKMHFLKRRLSGGGECGTIERIGENVYKVSFADKEVQERVLQRKFHTISLPRGELRLTVTRDDSLSHQPDLQHSSHQQAERNKKELEKVYTLDPYLLRYLKDSPKAAKVLHKQLSAINCSVRIDVEMEEAVVKGDVEKDPPGASDGASASGIAAERWEIQVDRVFIGLVETYLAHHVVDPAPAKALQRDLSFVTENLRVYRDGGYPVLVGEVGEVSATIAALARSVPIRKRCPVLKKQYGLVEEEFCREMRARFPNVKIHRDESNGVSVLLEGLDEEVRSGSARLDELIGDVKEKRVALPEPVLGFLTSSDALQRYQARFAQGLRHPVALEMTTGTTPPTELVLSSLSSGALEEAAAAVQRELRQETVELDGPVAAAPCVDGLKEALTRAKNQANGAELRVEVSYRHSQSGGASSSKTTAVQLVGYSADVGELKDVLLDYKLNQVQTQEQLSLPLPEMVDCFDKIASLIGVNQPGVRLTPSRSPSACVLLSGPRSLVQETREALRSGLARLTSDRLVLSGPVARLYFQGEGRRSVELVEAGRHVVISQQRDGSDTPSTPTVSGLTTTRGRRSSSRLSSIDFSMPSSFLTSSAGTTVSSGVISNIGLEIKVGNLEKQQVDVLVAPMIRQELTRTVIGQCLQREAGGTAMKANFDLAVASRNGPLVPGDVLQVDGPQTLGCSKVFFIECLPWDGGRGQGVQALRNGLAKALELCAQQGWRSVAMPVIGLGQILKYPTREAVEALTEEIGRFGRGGSTGSLTTVRVVVHPGTPDAEECIHDVSRDLSTIMNWGGRAIFHSLLSDLDVITLTLGGGVCLQLVFGDITNETTDAVVNTTDFVDFETPGVCKDILNMAGPEVEAHLKSAGRVNGGDIFASRPGQFPCKAILHLCGQRDAGVIEGLVRDIIRHCEEKGYRSVAIPAICAGTGGLDRGVVAKAILRGVSTGVSSTTLRCLSLVRLVVIKIDVFQAFKGAAGTTFPHAAVNTAAPSVQSPSTQQHLAPPPSSGATANLDLDVLLATSGTAAPAAASAFVVVGRSSGDVGQAMAELRGLYQVQCGSYSFTGDDLVGFTQDGVQCLSDMVDHLSLQMDRSPAAGGASGQVTWTVTGLKDGVNQVSQLISSSVKEKLTRELRGRQEDDTFGRVSWCILGATGHWERLPKAANHKLETRDVRGGVSDGQGVLWSVDAGRTEAATSGLQGTRRVAKLKRLQNQTDFSLPLYWDNMDASEQLKRVELQHSSAEFKTVKESFKRTVAKTVLKIERLQNVHLRRGYEVQRKRLSDTTQQGAAGDAVREKSLYHGTTHDNSKSIMGTGFNRSFAGQNATAYGCGTYFAVDASYSANTTYSKPGPDGTQLMFVARVLTGDYAQGQSGMRVPPEGSDSVVNDAQNPTIFVVFYDNQAYPDYLITFK